MCEEWEREAVNPTRNPDPFDLKSTQPYLPFPATVSAEQGTKWKLRSRSSFPCHPCRQKPTGTPAIEAWKPAAPPVFVAIDSTNFWWRNQLGFIPHPILCHFWPSIVAGGHRFVVDWPLKDLRLWELDPESSPRVGGHHLHRWTQCGQNFQTWAS